MICTPLGHKKIDCVHPIKIILVCQVVIQLVTDLKLTGDYSLNGTGTNVWQLCICTSVLLKGQFHEIFDGSIFFAYHSILLPVFRGQHDFDFFLLLLLSIPRGYSNLGYKRCKPHPQQVNSFQINK